MAVFFRAVVMLVTLVGLPAAWVYYGPLPQGPQRVVDRFVEVAREAVGWNQPVIGDRVIDEVKTAPRYEEVLPTEVETQTVSQATFQGSKPTVKLASASESIGSSVEPVPVQRAEIQPHLDLLKQLGAVNYSLEKWGAGYRFQCAVPLGDNVDFTRRFEAIDADPLATVRQVVGEVSSWQNARHHAVDSGTMWR